MFMVFVICLTATSVFGEQKIIKMSTTTSTQDSGLLDALLPELEKATGITVKVIAKGTGAAIRDGMDGNVDVIFVHAKEKEEQFVKDGYGTKRYAVMHNDFIIIGPKSDPAKISATKDVLQALKQIAQSGSMFVSRGDDSGTHTMEQDLWKQTKIALAKISKPVVKEGKTSETSFVQPENSDKWYLSIGQGMGKTLMFANEKQAYTLTDRATYVNLKSGKQPLDLEILCEGDQKLFNLYGVIPVNPKKFSHVKYDLAEQFAQWLISEKGQSLIANYKISGQQVFFPDAIPSVK